MATESTELNFEDLLMNKSKRSETVILPEMVTGSVFKNQSDNFIISALKSQIVLKIGCGSVGSHTLLKLNKMGVSAFIVFDPDILEAHNSASGMFDYSKHKNNMESGSYGSRYLSMLTNDKLSPFKVDWVFNNYLKGHDSQLYYKPFKTSFGISLTDSINNFRKTVLDMGFNVQYEPNGQATRSGAEHITIRSLDEYPTPTIVIISTDSLFSRLNSSLILYKKYRNSIDTLPLIDSRIANTLQGEVYCLDIMNNDQMLYWLNTMLATKFETFIDLYEHWLNEPNEFDFHNLTPNQCGDSMSIISSSCSALVICSLFRGLFEQTDPNYENVPFLMNFSFKNGFAMPYLNGLKFIDLLPTEEELELEED